MRTQKKLPMTYPPVVELQRSPVPVSQTASLKQTHHAVCSVVIVGTECCHGGHVGHEAIVAMLDNRAVVSMLDNPPPSKVDACSNATTVLLSYAVLIVLLKESFHRAQVAVTQIKYVGLVPPTLKLEFPGLSKRKRYDAYILELTLK